MFHPELSGTASWSINVTCVQRYCKHVEVKLFVIPYFSPLYLPVITIWTLAGAFSTPAVLRYLRCLSVLARNAGIGHLHIRYCFSPLPSHVVISFNRRTPFTWILQKSSARICDLNTRPDRSPFEFCLEVSPNQLHNYHQNEEMNCPAERMKGIVNQHLIRPPLQAVQSYFALAFV